MFPIIKCLLWWNLILMKRHSKLTGSTVGVRRSEVRLVETYVATPPALVPLSARYNTKLSILRSSSVILLFNQVSDTVIMLGL